MTPSGLLRLHLAPLLALSGVWRLAVSEAFSVPIVVANRDQDLTAVRPAHSPGRLLTESASASSAGFTTVIASFDSEHCSDTPVWISGINDHCWQQEMYNYDGCAISYSPSEGSGDSDDTPQLWNTYTCGIGLTDSLDSLYGDQAYMLIDYYSSDDCWMYLHTTAFVADGDCHASVAADTGTVFSTIFKILDEGVVSVATYNGSDCAGIATSSRAYTKDELRLGACDAGTKITMSSGYDYVAFTTAGIIGIIAGCVVVLATLVWIVLWERRRQRQRRDEAAGDVQPVGAGDSLDKTIDYTENPYQSAA